MTHIDLHLYNPRQVSASYPISSVDLASTLTLTQILGVSGLKKFCKLEIYRGVGSVVNLKHSVLTLNEILASDPDIMILW